MADADRRLAAHRPGGGPRNGDRSERSAGRGTALPRQRGALPDPQTARLRRTGYSKHPLEEGTAMNDPVAPEVTERPALNELTDDPQSRGRFLRMVGGAGAAGALSLLIAACGGDDEKESGSNGGSTTTTDPKSQKAGSGDLEIANYALTLEYLEADFYAAVIESGEVTDRKIAELAKSIGENEQAHVDVLKSMVEQMGGTAAAKPTTKFDDVLAGGPEMILSTAATVENLGAAAYLGQADKIKSMEVLAAALSIHTVEARHAAALNTLVGKTVVPDGAFAKPASKEEVLKQVQPFIAA
jgi:rubrerythrin